MWAGEKNTENPRSSAVTETGSPPSQTFLGKKKTDTHIKKKKGEKVTRIPAEKCQLSAEKRWFYFFFVAQTKV